MPRMHTLTYNHSPHTYTHTAILKLRTVVVCLEGTVVTEESSANGISMPLKMEVEAMNQGM